MANAKNKSKLQHVHATNALNYGQLGTATYMEHSADWAFLRGESGRFIHDLARAAAAFPFERVGLEADAFRSDTREWTDDSGVQSQVIATQNALQVVPEALCDITQKPKSICTNALLSDSGIEPALRPSQLAFGGAAAVLENGISRQTIPIVAIVSGRNLEGVRIVLIGKEPFQTTNILGLPHNYQLPKITYEEEDYWSGEGDPVQQVCFAAACDFETTQSAWMAARCRSATTIFHPLFHRAQMALESSSGRISANPILRISISRTGGHPHADVAFKPQDHKVLAIIDVRGNWSVWKIDVPRRSVTGRALFGIHLQSVGRLFTETTLVALQGDWHRICWISRMPHDSDRLLVSNRSHAALFDSVGHNLGALDLRTSSTKYREVVLDVTKSTTNPTHCYILTSRKILLMSAAEFDWADSTGQEQMAMLLSWSHYRGMADLSLTLMLAETAQATTILITSSNNSIVTACRTGLVLEKSPTPVSLADPFHFGLLNDGRVEQRSNSVRLLAFRDLQIQSRASLAGDEDPVLFKAFLGRPGIRCEELLYRCTDDVASSTFGQPHSTAIPLPMIRTLQKKSLKHVNLGGLSDFVVVGDTTVWMEGSISDRPFIKVSGQDVLSAQGSTNTMDWQDVYTLLGDVDGTSYNEARPLEAAMAIEELQLQLEKQEETHTTIRTLRELLDARISLSDFEAATRAFANLTTDVTGTEDQHFQITRLHVPERGFLSDTLSDTHDQLKASWVLPLSHSIGNKTRLAKDRLIRSVTADLVLSSITVGPVPAIGTDATQVQQQYPGPSEFSSSPASATSANQAEAEDPACTRLRRYAPLKKPIAPISTSRLLTNILAHLPSDIDAKPSDYNWRATEARLAAENSARGAEKIDPKARRRAERLAASQRKRLEAQKQISQTVEQDSAPPMIISSQYPVVREVQSSQAGPPMRDEEDANAPVFMTQPARGTFGSRVAPTSKAQAVRKKSRRQGF